MIPVKQKEEAAKAKAMEAHKAKEQAMKAKQQKAEQQAKEEEAFWAQHEQQSVEDAAQQDRE